MTWRCSLSAARHRPNPEAQRTRRSRHATRRCARHSGYRCEPARRPGYGADAPGPRDTPEWLSGAVIGDHQFPVRERLSQHGFNGGEQILEPIEYRQDDGNCGRHDASPRGSKLMCSRLPMDLKRGSGSHVCHGRRMLTTRFHACQQATVFDAVVGCAGRGDGSKCAARFVGANSPSTVAQTATRQDESPHDR
jgi:hypothetical protein